MMAVVEAAAAEGPEGEAMSASAASREAAVRRGAVQSTRARERDEEVGCGTRRAPGAEEAA
jgi:hypothetical protein